MLYPNAVTTDKFKIVVDNQKFLWFRVFGSQWVPGSKFHRYPVHKLSDERGDAWNELNRFLNVEINLWFNYLKKQEENR